MVGAVEGRCGPTRLAKHEASNSPFLVAQGVGDLESRSIALAWTASTSSTSTEIPGAAGSSLPMMFTWAEVSFGEATVATHPRSITTSKPSSSTKKSRVSADRSDLIFGTALLIFTFRVLTRSRGSSRSWRRARGVGALFPSSEDYIDAS